MPRGDFAIQLPDRTQHGTSPQQRRQHYRPDTPQKSTRSRQCSTRATIAIVNHGIPIPMHIRSVAPDTLVVRTAHRHGLRRRAIPLFRRLLRRLLLLAFFYPTDTMTRSGRPSISTTTHRTRPQCRCPLCSVCSAQPSNPTVVIHGAAGADVHGDGDAVGEGRVEAFDHDRVIKAAVFAEIHRHVGDTSGGDGAGLVRGTAPRLAKLGVGGAL